MIKHESKSKLSIVTERQTDRNYPELRYEKFRFDSLEKKSVP